MNGCPSCGNDVLQPKTGRPRVYCNQVCRQSAFRRRRGQVVGQGKRPPKDD